MNYVLWGTKIKDADWMEQTITDTSDKQNVEKAKEWAKDNGFDRLRVMTYNNNHLEKPNFQQSITV